MSTKINKYTPVLVNGQVIGVVTEDTLLESSVLPIGLFFLFYAGLHQKRKWGT